MYVANLPEKEIHIWLSPSQQTEGGEGSRLSDRDSLHLDRITSHKRRQEFLSGRWLLDRALSTYLGQDWPHNFELQVSPTGKPFLKGEPIHFSLSHSHGWMGVAISTHGQVGFDMERVRELKDLVRFSQRALSSEQLREMQQVVDPVQSSNYLFWKWTEREAKGKLSGEGLQYLEPFEFEAEATPELLTWSWFLREGYYLSLAYRASCPVERLRVIDF